jgi:hypothetical protein
MRDRRAVNWQKSKSFRTVWTRRIFELDWGGKGDENRRKSDRHDHTVQTREGPPRDHRRNRAQDPNKYRPVLWQIDREPKLAGGFDTDPPQSCKNENASNRLLTRIELPSSEEKCASRLAGIHVPRAWRHKLFRLHLFCFSLRLIHFEGGVAIISRFRAEIRIVVMRAKEIAHPSQTPFPPDYLVTVDSELRRDIDSADVPDSASNTVFTSPSRRQNRA